MLSLRHQPSQLSAEHFEAALRSVCGSFDIAPNRDQETVLGQAMLETCADIELAIVSNNLQRIDRTRTNIKRDSGENYFLIIQHEGRALMSQNGSRSVLMPGDMVFIDSARPSEFTYFGDYSQQASLHLQRKEVEAFLGPNLVGGTSLSRNDPTARAIHAVIMKVLESADDSNNSQFLKHALYGLLGAFLLGDCSKAQPGALGGMATQNALLGRALDYIGLRFRDPEFSVSDIAKALGVNMRQVQRAFEGLGTSPSKYVLSKRLELARDKIIARNSGSQTSSIANIAYSAGFSDLSYFHRRFRETFGCPPGDYNSVTALQE